MAKGQGKAEAGAGGGVAAVAASHDGTVHAENSSPGAAVTLDIGC